VRECGVKSVVPAEEHSECCETETENAIAAAESKRGAGLARAIHAGGPTFL